MRRCSVGAGWALALLLQGAGAGAQTPAQGALSLPEAWENADGDELDELIQRAALGNPQAGTRNVSAVLLRGTSPRVAATALDALAAMGRPEAAPVIERFLEHHRPSLRMHAIDAAGVLHTPSLVRALEARLGDPEPAVRARAAWRLGEVGSRANTPRLWLALDRDLTASATARGNVTTFMHALVVSLARLGNTEDLDRLLAYLRRVPFPAMADAFRAVLDRRDVQDPVKIRVVQALGNLGTREAREFLSAWAGAQPAGRAPPNPVVAAARTAAGRI
ncbi:MAG: HEAT repeat domain-containing protein [Deltaproteobacteria bacterium]|nr:HEAT repeat domain-containing protein [Deltaproteobacteria bacterium]